MPLKLQVLRCLCDHSLDCGRLRFELDRRQAQHGLTGDMRTQFDEEDEFLRESGALLSLAGLRESGGVGEGVMEAEGATDVQEPEAGDGNADECCLCGMDGNLLCCDGCPASFHSRCVSVVSSSLPSGTWFCPECAAPTVAAGGPGRHKGESSRGASSSGAGAGEDGGSLRRVCPLRPDGLRVEAAGTDLFGRLFMVACDHVVV